MDVKEMLEDAKKDLHDLREKYKAANEQLAANGRVTAELRAEMDKRDAAMEQKFENAQKRWDEIEREWRRAEAMKTEGDPENKIAKDLAVFNAGLHNDLQLRSRAGDFRPFGVEEYQAYNRGFAQYAIGGAENIESALVPVMKVGFDPQQGYWVPPTITGRIVEYQHETSPLRDWAEVITIDTDRAVIEHDLDRAGAERVGERTTRGRTNRPKVGKSEVALTELHAMFGATRWELDMARKDLVGWLSRKAGMEFSLTENKEFVTGSKKLEARGFATLTAGAPTVDNFLRIEQVATGKAGAFLDNPKGPHIFKDLSAKLKTPYLRRAAWGLARTTLGEARKLQDSNGQYQIHMDRDPRGRPTWLIEGLPVASFDDMAAIAANSLSIALADWFEAYIIIDGAGFRMLRDPYSAKNSGEVEFSFYKRGTGHPKNTDAIKLAKFATSV